MADNALVYLIDSVLGRGKPTSKGNRAYHCPECKHHKLKLEVNLEETSPHFQSYQCWVCGFKGKKLITLFKKIEAESDKVNELRLLVKSASTDTKIVVENKKISLPEEFISLVNPPDNLSTKHATHYLKKRGITKTKKSTKAFDESTGEWKPKFGYGSKNVEPDWLIEVPGNANPMEDQYEKLNQEKKERVEKNKKRQKRNEEEASVLASASSNSKTPLVPGSAAANQAIREMKKKQIEKQLQESKVTLLFFLRNIFSPY